MLIREVLYRCAQCGATDTDRLTPDEFVTPALGCWRCKKGFGLGIDDQVEKQIGMLPVKITQYDNKAADNNVGDNKSVEGSPLVN